MVRPLVLAALLSLPLAACGSDLGGDGEELPQSFRFTVASNPCFDSTFTVSDAREAVPVVAGRFFQEDLTCEAVSESTDVWVFACDNTGGTVEIRLAKSLAAGSVVVDHFSNNTICEGEHAMLTVEVLTP